jgi:HD-GYP domain-containing protein (c-di-GMP phosphodiesterase class II)
MVLQHHERMDGSGYPDGLQGPEIALGSRIIAVADVFESMVTSRPYRNARGFDKAVKELQRGSGTAYDTDVVEACLRVIENGQLSFDEAGMVSCPGEDRALACLSS